MLVLSEAESMPKKFEDPKANLCLTPDQIEKLRKEGKLPPAPPDDPRSHKTMRETPESKLKTRLLPFLVKALKNIKGGIQACGTRLTALERPEGAKLRIPGKQLESLDPITKAKEIAKLREDLMAYTMQQKYIEESLEALKHGQPLSPNLVNSLKEIEREKAANLRQTNALVQGGKTDQSALTEAQAELAEVAELINDLEK